ncbi:unnamed protein product [Lepeophtheirus salmonis]|uniref:(salmon louse) hypothetical protein n=1 Tax=Lepeophtheirus salmonis TaxID=72036 RepID=A0A7R8D250_LEPSM|nr:unnamed protein product [Lepeophtheirus salmonis]CAF2954321.1 unnamed protein product [Lepeophtheirus salmonis]
MNTHILFLCTTFFLLSAGWISTVLSVLLGPVEAGIVALGLVAVAKAKIAAGITGYAVGRAIRGSRRRGNRRHRFGRSVVDDSEEIWGSVSKWDEQQCVPKLFCEIGTGALNENIYSDIVNGLLTLDPQDLTESVRYTLKKRCMFFYIAYSSFRQFYPYINAAREGNRHRSLRKCQLKYKCNSTGADLLSAVPKYLYPSQ